MNYLVYNAVEAILEADTSLSKQDKVKILAVCKNPSMFVEPVERILPRVLTLNEVAQILRVTRTTIWRMMKDGRLRRMDYWGRARFRQDEVERLMGIGVEQIKQDPQPQSG